MRRVLMITAATLVLGVSGAIAAPMHGSSGGTHANMGANFGARGAGPAFSGKGNFAARNNFAPAKNFAAPNNFAAAAPNRVQPNHAPGPRYAWNGHHGWHRRGRYGGGWGGLYAYEPNYSYCYDNGYWPYYNGYYNNCYYDYDQPGPGFSFGWGW
jgi:hypothetical protein